MRRLLAIGLIAPSLMVLAACTDETPVIPARTIAACADGAVELVAGDHGAAAGSSVLTFTANNVGNQP